MKESFNVEQKRIVMAITKFLMLGDGDTSAALAKAAEYVVLKDLDGEIPCPLSDVDMSIAQNVSMADKGIEHA